MEKDSFTTPDKKEIGYDILSFTDFGVATFIIIIPTDEKHKHDLMSLLKKQKGLSKYSMQFYIPNPALGTGNAEKEIENFAGLVKYITGRKKLVDADLYIIAPESKKYLLDNYVALIQSGDEKYRKHHVPKETIALSKYFTLTNEYLVKLGKKN
ncbi:hypothetical protein BD749_3884 [Pontibacter ramchanderi]|uniref:Uncharacterized protein n=2 Tax=Pontibacter ramchanderi TaxID=1179743 RepID=A0A2N3U6M1_9BACT|nr:hypothetical protein BD749_3884 [Pontibacter ramchanderi]